MKRARMFLWSILVFLTLGLPSRATEMQKSLAGDWRFALDPSGDGITRELHKNTLTDRIRLPGTTDEAAKGPKNTSTGETRRLTRMNPYSGAAWYQRDLDIPEEWKGKRLTLLLERTKRSRVWLDGRAVGEQVSLAVPHVYDFGNKVAPGSHVLTILVNNGKKPPVNGGHQLSEDTQTDWNGILGRIELRASDPVWMDHVQIYPDPASHRARVHIYFGILGGVPASGTVELSARAWNTLPGSAAKAAVARFDRMVNGGVVSADLELGADSQNWDEFTPALYRLTIDMRGKAASSSVSDHYQTDFGLRHFAAAGSQFVLNGRTVFLRGKNDACVFPLTGYAPMALEAWIKVFQTARSYGINHYRFHSWCPPEAAFAAADRVGIYLQPELPNFGGDLARDRAAAEFTRAEGHRILREYGNHPSFVMLALGNELRGGREARAGIVAELRALDPRRLYAQGSNYDLDEPGFAAGDDYWTTMRTRKGAEGAVRGSYSHADPPLGHVQALPPGTTHDYSRAIADVPVPVIGHEIGQYQTFPNFKEVAKYTGVLRAFNFGVFQERLKARGMLDLADYFVRASGSLSALCYREEIEAALRTPRFGGFQLLDLQDFPGQGTALVGMLDAFMDSKGLIEPKVWREFCSETVPLLVMKRYTWTAGETFEAEVKVANYGPSAIEGKAVSWNLSDRMGKTVTLGRLPVSSIGQGALTEAGRIRIPLNRMDAPQKLQISLTIEGTPYENHYSLWVYPSYVDETVPPEIIFTRALNARILGLLESGSRVFYIPQQNAMPRSIQGFFAPDFWCFPMFRDIAERQKLAPAPGTMGILCDPKHPAFSKFPTEPYTNWQWWHILMNSRAVILDEAAAGFRPVVYVIDNFDRNHKLGLVFEGRVGQGKLLVCASDLPAHKAQPEVRQFLRSLMEYAASPRFEPAAELSPALLQRLFAVN